ncbi:MAG: hypothetical protein FWF00_00615 [Endomicrobia bacterium]|nr:hypothetical protein [Endomicrobiia bacterium]MCL2506179.1 hypothetical protein [Endomicrobiia bacterium]
MKRALFLMLAMVFCFMVSFSTDVSAQVAGLKTRQEVAPLLSNFSISLVFDAKGQNPYYMYQASCDKGMVSEMKGDRNSLIFYDFTANKEYYLDAETKTGDAEDIDTNDPNYGYRFFGGNILSHAFIHSSYRDIVKKIGNEKVAGRNTTVYEVTFEGMNTKMKIWVDDEYGFTLKYIQTGSSDMKMEVTEFKVGGVTVEDMLKRIDFKDYKIE